MRHFGLIGFPLSHSFSQKYFTDKFHREGIKNAEYNLFEIKDINSLNELLDSNPNLLGLNVTIPYKEGVIDYLDDHDFIAKKVGAVNVVKIEKSGLRTGYNSDYYGFRTSLEKWMGSDLAKVKGFVLGTGGASKAVRVVLDDCNIEYKTVSRDIQRGDLTYFDLFDNSDLIMEHRLVINTTPLGMHPRINEAPNLPYEVFDKNFYLYDLIYNPEKTLFLEKGNIAGAQIKNGLEMLVLQAEKSWDIWNGV